MSALGQLLTWSETFRPKGAFCLLTDAWRTRGHSEEDFDLPVPSENLIRWIRSRKENRIMIETDGDLLQTSARIYVGLLSFA